MIEKQKKKKERLALIKKKGEGLSLESLASDKTIDKNSSSAYDNRKKKRKPKR